MNASQAEAPGDDSQAIDGRYEPIGVVAQSPLAIRMTAIDREAPAGASSVLLTVPAPSLPPRRHDALRERFHRLAQLAHPNIPAYRCRSDAGSTYCVSDRVDGESLADIVALLAPDVLERHEIDRIVRTVGSALAAAHQRGLSHGALGKDVVIVTPALDIRLTGFDLGGGRLAFDPAADIAALAGMAAELHARPLRRDPATAAGPEPDAGPGAGLKFEPAWRHTPRERKPRRLRPARLALYAALVLAAAMVDPSDVARLARVPGDATGPPSLAEPTAAAGATQDAAGDSGTRPADVPATTPAAAPAETPAETPGEPAAGLADEADTAAIPGRESAARTVPVVALPARNLAARTPVSLRFQTQGSRLTVGESNAMARVSLRTHSGRSTSIIWWLADGSARSPSDYADLGLQTATIPRDSSIDIVVPLVADAVAEGDEEFEIFASAVENGKQSGVPINARIRILDDD